MLKSTTVIIFVLVFCFSGFGQETKTTTDGAGTGNGRGTGNGTSENDKIAIKQPEIPKFTPKINSSLKILSKPKANYTDQARQNQVQGNVLLRVTFKKNGKIGSIKIVRGLPDGLSQNTVEAAKKIRFEPQIENGKPVTVTKNISYNFTIY